MIQSTLSADCRNCVRESLWTSIVLADMHRSVDGSVVSMALMRRSQSRMLLPSVLYLGELALHWIPFFRVVTQQATDQIDVVPPSVLRLTFCFGELQRHELALHNKSHNTTQCNCCVETSLRAASDRDRFLRLALLDDSFDFIVSPTSLPMIRNRDSYVIVGQPAQGLPGGIAAAIEKLE